MRETIEFTDKNGHKWCELLGPGQSPIIATALAAIHTVTEPRSSCRGVWWVRRWVMASPVVSGGRGMCQAGWCRFR